MGFVTTTERPELTAVAEYRLTVDADGRITSARPIERAPTCLVGYWDYGTVPEGRLGFELVSDQTTQNVAY